MRVALVTTLPSLSENTRIREEVEKLGHNFELVDLADFNFLIKENKKVEIAKLSQLKADVIILRGIFNSIKAISTAVHDLRKVGVKIFDNNFIEHKYSIDKVTDLLKLSLEGIKVPATAYVRDFSKFSSKASSLGYPLIVKSTRMGKGASIFKLDSEKELSALIEKLQGSDKDAKSYIMQEFIDYQYDLRCLVIGKDVFTMRRIPPKGDFRANFSLGGKVEIFDLDEEGKSLTTQALKSINMSIGGVDILIDKNDNKYVLEVNHTAGFVGMEEATGKNIGKLYVDHAIKVAK